MKKIKSILLSLLGQKNYLRLTSRMFFLYFKQGWLRNNPIYYTHYFCRNFIKAGDTVIDIGGNLGYFSKLFAELVGNNGKVFSVEPIALYRSVLHENVGTYTQVEILPFALGETEAVIKMGNPTSDKHRHGLMRVLKDDEAKNGSSTYDVQMKTPDQLFGHVQNIHYIKCDIEGYEVPVIPAMRNLLTRHQPIVQVETDGANKIILFNFFKTLGYRNFSLDKDQLRELVTNEDPLSGDLIAIPAEKVGLYEQFVK